ncbi:MAG: ABC transporter ATP-binding protein [Fimbriimonadaceae bacterium]|nr:ABC transporter ATP-binding protein [Fimbriimonadaceae bacterium]
MTTAQIPLIRTAVQAISDAAGYTEQRVLTDGEAAVLAEKLGQETGDVKVALSKVQQARDASRETLRSDETELLAKELKEDPEEVRQALTEMKGELVREPQTARGAVRILGLMGILVVVLYIFKYWFTRGQTYYLSKAAARLASNLRLKLFKKLQRLPITYFNEKRSGGIQSVLTNDVGVYQTAVTIIRDSIDGPLKAITALGYIIYTQWQLAALTMLFLPIMAVAINRNSRKMKLAQSQVQGDLATLNAMTLESLQGTRVVKAFAAEERVEENYSELVEKTFRSQMAATRRQAALRPLVELIGAVALALVLYLCGWLAFRQELQVADLIALIYALDVINQGFRNLASVQNTYAQVQAASDRIYDEVLSVPDEHFESRGAKILESPKAEVEFRNVSFTYPDGTVALDNVSFTINAGHSLALVGSSGAGKSTIADLLLRFYNPTSGAIYYDGVDIRELDVAWWRSQIGVVPQQTFLFAGSIADNVRLGNADASDEGVVEALKAAHADVFVERFPERHNSLIGELGSGLSGGEKQRIAIARALVRKPHVLLLDEATSNLDSVSEKVVQQALEEVMHTRTTLFIAHRLTTAARADRILVLRRGEVVELGSHKELLAQNGVYAAMYGAFSSGVID